MPSCRVCGKSFKRKVWNQQTCSKRCGDRLRKGRVKVGKYKPYRL